MLGRNVLFLLKAFAIVRNGDIGKGDCEHVWVDPVMVNELDKSISAEGIGLSSTTKTGNATFMIDKWRGQIPNSGLCSF